LSSRMALYVVATPIGNLEDLSPRAVKTLGAVAAVACEDTRRTLNLLRHFSIHKPLLRYDDHVHGRALPEILGRLKAGEDVALVTDAGTPGVSDPGGRLVKAVVEAGVAVVPIPGASAALTALAGAGFPTDGFTFLGFLSRRSIRIRRELESAGRERAIVFFESVFRLKDTLEEAKTVFGDIPCAVGRELTKIHEEFIRGSITEVIAALAAKKELLGEATVVLAPHHKDWESKAEEND
jgi:16S rRNA (cytidine1402-2'-O)-methyltransferase